MLEGVPIKNKLKSIFRWRQAAWKELSRPTPNANVPIICTALGAKTKHPAHGKATTDIFKSVSGGKILS